MNELAPMFSELELVEECACDMLLGGLNSCAWMLGVNAAAFTLIELL